MVMTKTILGGIALMFALSGVAHAGDAEIGQISIAIFIDQDILRLQITMNDHISMSKV